MLGRVARAPGTLAEWREKSMYAAKESMAEAQRRTKEAEAQVGCLRVGVVGSGEGLRRCYAAQRSAAQHSSTMYDHNPRIYSPTFPTLIDPTHHTHPDPPTTLPHNTTHPPTLAPLPRPPTPPLFAPPHPPPPTIALTNPPPTHTHHTHNPYPPTTHTHRTPTHPPRSP